MCRCPGSGISTFLIVSLCLAVATTVLSAEVPAELKALMDAKKWDEVNQKIVILVPASSGADRLELIRAAYDHDPDIGRLKNNLTAWLQVETDSLVHSGIARLLGQLALLQRDYLTAAQSFRQVTGDAAAA